MSEDEDPMVEIMKKAKFGIVSEEDAEGVHFVVCVPAPDHEPLLAPDNLMGFCCQCGCKVQFRPNAPKTPKRICINCAAKDPEMGEGVEVVVTPRQAIDLRALMKKFRQG